VETVNSIAEAVVASTRPTTSASDLGRLRAGRGRAALHRRDDGRRQPALAPLRPDAILLNCAPPADCAAGLRELAPHSPAATGVYPHVGRFDPPEWLFTDEYPPPRSLDEARGWRERGAAILGGCCGTTPSTSRRWRVSFAAVSAPRYDAIVVGGGQQRAGLRRLPGAGRAAGARVRAPDTSSAGRPSPRNSTRASATRRPPTSSR